MKAGVPSRQQGDKRPLPGARALLEASTNAGMPGKGAAGKTGAVFVPCPVACPEAAGVGRGGEALLKLASGPAFLACPLLPMAEGDLYECVCVLASMNKKGCM
jgi:hypothetical protein